MKIKCPNCSHEFEISDKKVRRKFSERTRDPIAKLRRILNYLKKAEDWVWIRKIAKSTHLKPYSVSYLIDKYLLPYLEILDTQDVYENLGIKMKMFRLKNKDLDVNGVLKDISVRKS